MNEPAMPYSLIPLSSNEPLWEWDLVSDAIFLSLGARKSLGLSTPPASMGEFYQLLTPDVAQELVCAREGVLSGKTGSIMECSYICNGLWAHEYLMVVNRNSSGKATRVIGRITAARTLSNTTGFRGGNELLPDTGIWIFDVRKRKIWHDRICAAILGEDSESRNSNSVAECLEKIHPAERRALQRHYNLVCDGPFLGDEITDLVRICNADGQYISLILRASVLERDDSGKALIISGLCTRGEPVEAPSIMKDDRLFHALDNMGSGQWNWDTKNDVMYFCPRYLAILGYGLDDRENFTSNWRDHIHPDDLAKVGKAQLEVVPSPENGDTYECTYRMRRADGTWAWIFDRGCVTWRDLDGSAGHMLGSITNITTAQAGRDKLEELVRHDSLTGLRSRAYCNLEIEHVEQNKIRPVTVISIDITGLKMVNDTIGHAGGDELLTQAAFLLRNSLRASDCIARMGGDEFMVLLPNCNESKGKKLLGKIENFFAEHNAQPHTIPVFAAFGVASSEDPNEEMSHIIARADMAMYANKKANRKTAHAAIKAWIKAKTGKDVGIDDRVAD